MRRVALALMIALLTGGAAHAQEREALRQDENTDPNLAPSAQKVEPEREPFARQGRACLNLTYGFGSAALGDMHDLSDRYQPDPSIDAEGNLQINAEFGFTYYFHYYIMAHVAFGAIYEKASADTGGGRIFDNYNLMFEVPILLGGYFPFKDRFYVYAMIGPTIHTYVRSWWDLDGPGIPDASGPTGVGMQAVLGLDVMTSEPFSVGLALKGRYHKTGALTVKGTEVLYPKGTNREYTLDFSGISLDLVLRFWVF